VNNFSIKNGQIIDPTGKPFTISGLNIGDPNHANQILSLFPSINFLRIALGNYDAPSLWSVFINQMTDLNILCEIEHHPWPLVNALSGNDLITESTWYVTWAKSFINNPYVCFGSMNEPQGGNLTAQHVATYSAIRGAGSNALIFFEAGIGGGNPGATGVPTLTASAYRQMTNVAFDEHFYGWVTAATDLTSVMNKLIGSAATQTGVQAIQAISTADGTAVVCNLEFGPSTSGSSTDKNAPAVIAAVTSAAKAGITSGFAGWHWNADPFNAVQVNNVLTSWGNTLAASIKGIHVAALPESAQGTTIGKPTDPAIVNSEGKAWTLTTGGQVAVNGVADTTTANVASMNYASHRVVQVNKAGEAYSKALQSDAWRDDGSILPPVVVPPVISTGWIDGSVPGLPYKLLLPANYNPATAYPVMMYMHQLDMGGDWTDLGNWLNTWFNNSTFRAKHPCILIAPLLNQSADPSMNSFNFGGMSATVTAGRDAVHAILAQVRAQYRTDPTRLYVTGNSMGGIGSWEAIAQWPGLYAGALILAGASYYRSPTATAAILKNTPIWAIHGAQDTTVMLQWDRAMYVLLGPGTGGEMKYSELAGVGHDVWDTVYPDPQYTDWLFAQVLPGAVITPPVVTPPVTQPVGLSVAQKAQVDAIVAALTALRNSSA
jgi:predicted esterase